MQYIASFHEHFGLPLPCLVVVELSVISEQNLPDSKRGSLVVVGDSTEPQITFGIDSSKHCKGSCPQGV